jgi:imidazolonepropionase-like amidohydrolase
MTTHQPANARFLVLTLMLCVLLAAPAAAQEQSRDVAFVNVNVLPMDSERILQDHTVIVRGDTIVRVGPAAKVKVPAGALRIDGKGKYLIPGMAEMHGHVPPPQAPPEFTEAVLFLYVSNGVTTVRGMLGAPNQLALRERANTGELVSPTLYLAGPSFSGNSVQSPQQAVEMVKRQKDEGWDLLKVHPGLTREQYDAMARTAHDAGITFAGHVPAEVGLLHALKMGQETIDHIDGYIEHTYGDEGTLDQARLKEAVRATKESGAWVVPTMALWETLLGVADLDQMLSYPELRYMPPQQVAAWEKAHRGRQGNPKFDRKRMQQIAADRRKVLKALQDAGVPIIFGTDAPQQFSVPGFSIHHEMQHMLAAGLTPYQILVSATRNPGEYHKRQGRFGTVTEGSRADMVLVSGDPLQDLAHLAKPAGVMVRGRWLSASDIQSRLDEIAQQSRQPD